MSYTATKQKMYIPAQLYDNKTKIRKIEDHEAAAISQDLEATAIYDEEKLRAAKGITSAFIICISFWLIVIMLVVWVV